MLSFIFNKVVFLFVVRDKKIRLSNQKMQINDFQNEVLKVYKIVN